LSAYIFVLMIIHH